MNAETYARENGWKFDSLGWSWRKGRPFTDSDACVIYRKPGGVLVVEAYEGYKLHTTRSKSRKVLVAMKEFDAKIQAKGGSHEHG